MFTEKKTLSLSIIAITALVIVLALLYIPNYQAPAMAKSIKATAGGIVSLLEEENYLVSPDTRFILKKRPASGTRFALTIAERESGNVVSKIESEPQFLISWRPHSSVVSFVRDSKGDQMFRMFLWDYVGNQITKPNFPVLPAANRLMRWAPSGRLLAFRLPRSDSSREEIEIFDSQSLVGGTKPLFGSDRMIDFRWSPDSVKLAVVTESANGVSEIYIIDPLSGATNKVVRPRGNVVKSFSWDINGRSLLTCSNLGGGAYAIERVELETHRSERIFSSSSEIAQPFQLNERDMIYTMKSGRFNSLMLWDGIKTHRILGDDRLIEVMAVSRERNIAIIDVKSPTFAPGLFECDVYSGSVKPLVEKSIEDVIAPIRLDLFSSKARSPFPVYFWKPAGELRGLVVRFPVNRGAHAPIFFEPAVQYLLRNGVGCLAFEVDEKDDREDLDRALSTMGFIEDRITVPRDNVVLFGESGATPLTIDTAANMRVKRGGVLLRGVPERFSVEPLTKHEYRVVILQGENDKVTPISAIREVERVFGASSIRGVTGAAIVLDNEGHSIRLASSKAIRTAAISELARSAINK